VASLTFALIVACASPGLAQTTETSTDQSASTTASTTSTTSTSTTEAGDNDGTETSETTDPSTTTSGSSTTSNGDATTSSEISNEELQAEKDRVKAAEAANARQVNVASADLKTVTNALSALDDKVKSQEAMVDLAAQQVMEAQAIAQAANDEVAELGAQVVDLEAKSRDQAIRSFQGNSVEVPDAMLVNDLNVALRMRTLLNTATKSDIDYISELMRVQDALDVKVIQADEAIAAAEDLQEAGEEELAQLEQDKQAQAELAADADERLDHLLSERAALASLGEELASQSAADEAALVKELASVPAPPPPAKPTPVPASTGTIDIRDAGKGIRVHVSIVADIQRLLADADAAGVNLAGGGYRDPAAQIRTRINNCGSSNYAIYQMPARRCSPPTARPGRSMHEQGKAIDFTFNGRLIRSRSGPGWNWLRANAAKYGLQNLPSEPWHWSTNGR